MYRHREFRMVETERLTVSEWTSEGSLDESASVGADGTPPVIHRGTYDGTCKRVDIFTNVNLGGIAGVQLLSHVDEELFFIGCAPKSRPPAPALHRPPEQILFFGGKHDEKA